jgi:hypothetical protein
MVSVCPHWKTLLHRKAIFQKIVPVRRGTAGVVAGSAFHRADCLHGLCQRPAAGGKGAASSEELLWQQVRDQFSGSNLVVSVSLIYAGIAAACILYSRGVFPARLRNAVRYAFAFEVSRRVAAIAVASLLLAFLVFEAPELAYEETFDDYSPLKTDTQNWPNGAVGVFNNFLFSIDYFLFWVSLYVFGNIRLIPLLASASLLAVTYLLTAELARKRFAGLVAMVVVLQSTVFLTYDTVVSFDNFWILFYVLSLYLVHRGRWRYLSPAAHYLAASSKPLAAVFSPITIFMIYRSEMGRRDKAVLMAVYAAFAAAAAAAVLTETIVADVRPITFGDFLGAIYWIPEQLHTDRWLVVPAAPMAVGLFLLARRGVRHADTAIFMIASIVVIFSLMPGLVGGGTFLYRYISLIVFIAIGFGMLFARADKPVAKPRHEKWVTVAVFSFSLPVVMMLVVSLLFLGQVSSLIDGWNSAG